jgi:hypothetical protein
MLLKSNAAGSTPTIVVAWFNVMDRPTTRGSAPKRRSHTPLPPRRYPHADEALGIAGADQIV